MGTQEEFDSKAWIAESVAFVARRDRTTKDVQIEKLRRGVFTEASHTAYIRKKYFKGVRRKVDESIYMTRDEVIACAKILGVPNPFKDEVQLPPGYVLYHFYGSVNADFLQEPDVSSQDEPRPVPFIRHPIYPNATPMAWVVIGDSMDRSVPDGSIAFGVDFQETSGTPLNGDLVVVDHILGGRVERTIKRVKLTEAGIELHPESTNPKYRPIILKSVKKNDSEIRIRSLIHRTDKDQNQRR